jgi:peptidase E
MSEFVLIGGGDISAGETEKIDRFIISLVRKKNPGILFFPTAANDSGEYADLFRKYYLSLGCREINSCFVQKENTESILRKMRKADVIYLGGGQTSLLIDLFIEKDLVSVLKDLAEGGTVIVGMSAGAIALGETALLSELEEQEEVFAHGWGLIPKTICIPHYQRKHRDRIDRFQPRYPSQNILTIMEKQAYFVETSGKEILKQTLING